ncbi:hypothetical protein BDR05DRAFT_591735 [Suillus weaverae]|nr:hypothetical protein BDR05DRAFT_591735 [Suillus weaverae]
MNSRGEMMCWCLCLIAAKSSTFRIRGTHLRPLLMHILYHVHRVWHAFYLYTISSALPLIPFCSSILIPMCSSHSLQYLSLWRCSCISLFVVEPSMIQ